MEFLRNINFDVNKILILLFIPGSITFIPIFFATYNLFAKNNIDSTALYWIFFFSSITIGQVLENIGSLIENYILPYFYKNKYPYYLDDWNKYLSLRISDNPDIIGQRYLRTILHRMKFELSMGVSFFISALIILIYQVSSIESQIVVNFSKSIPFIMFYGSIYFIYEAKQSSIVLIKTRRIILDKLEKC